MKKISLCVEDLGAFLFKKNGTLGITDITFHEGYYSSAHEKIALRVGGEVGSRRFAGILSEYFLKESGMSLATHSDDFCAVFGAGAIKFRSEKRSIDVFFTNDSVKSGRIILGVYQNPS